MKIFGQIKELLFESGVYSLANIFTRFLQVLLLPLYTRLLTPADYGILSTITTVSVILAIFVTFQLDSSVFRWYVETEDEQERKKTFASSIWFQLVVSALVTLALYLYQHSFGVLIENDGQIVDIGVYLVIAAATVFFMTFENVLLVYLRIQRRKWETMIVVVISALMVILTTVYLVAVLKLGVYGVLMAGLVASIVKAILSLGILREWFSPLNFSYSRLKEMLAYSLPFVPAGLALWVVGLIDRLFLLHYSGATETGLYHIGNNIASGVTIVVAGFLQAWSPFAFSISDSLTAKETYAAALEIFLVLTCLASVFISFYSPEFLQVFTTIPYYSAYNTVGILCLSSVLLGVYQISGIGLALAKKTLPIFYATAASALVNISLNFTLIPVYGRMGASWATLLSVLVIPTILFFVSQKYYFIPYRFVNSAMIFVLSLMLILVGNLLADYFFVKTLILIGILISFVLFLNQYRKFLTFDNFAGEKA